VALAQGGSISGGAITVFGPTGRPLAGATVTVCAYGATGIPCSPTVTVYSDPALTTPTTNPQTSDGNGQVFVYAAPGRYTYTVTGNGITGQSFTATVAGSGGGDVLSSGNNTLTGNNTFRGPLNCKNLQGAVRCVDAANTPGWTGTDMGAWINAADSDLGATPGEVWIFGGGTMTTTLTPSSNHTYRLFPGTYNFPAPWLFTSLTGFKIICEPGCTLNNQQTTYASSNATLAPLIEVDSGNATVQSNLTADGTLGATSITVASGTGLSAGDEIAIFDTRFAEVNQIASSYVGGTTVPLVRPLENLYSVSLRGAQISKFIWAKNFLIRGVVAKGKPGIQGGGNASGAAVLINNALDGTVEDLTCQSGAGRCYLSRLYSSRIHALGIRAFNPSDNSIENYITTSHNVVQDVWATNSTSNGIAIHGFHQTLINAHSWGNSLSGLQIDSGQFINIVGGQFDTNGANGVTVSGGTLNTTEATDVSLNGVQSEDNAGDGLNAGTGGNSRLTVTGGSYIRNRGTGGGIVLNAALPGTTITGVSDWGNTNAGIEISTSGSFLNLSGINFQGPTANGTSDISIDSGVTLVSSQIVGNSYQATTHIGGAGTLDASSLVWGGSGNGSGDKYQVPTGLGNNLNLGANRIQIGETTGPVGLASNSMLWADSTAHRLKINNNNGVAENVVGSVAAVDLDAVYGTYRVTADQTITAGASLTNIPGLSWTMPANTALNVAFECHGSYSQATAAASDQFGIQDVTVAPTNIYVKKVVYTSTSALLSDNLPTLTTTTATAIGGAFTPSAANTVFNFDIFGMIEQPSNASSSVINIMAQFTTNNGTIKRGSFCRVW
jgi:hypothetical protein